MVCVAHPETIIICSNSAKLYLRQAPVHNPVSDISKHRSSCSVGWLLLQNGPFLVIETSTHISQSLGISVRSLRDCTSALRGTVFDPRIIYVHIALRNPVNTCSAQLLTSGIICHNSSCNHARFSPAFIFVFVTVL